MCKKSEITNPTRQQTIFGTKKTAIRWELFDFLVKFKIPLKLSALLKKDQTTINAIR